jgi:hypothetical protein
MSFPKEMSRRTHLSLADDADLFATIRLMIRSEMNRWNDGGSLLAEDGIIANGSWNPADGTVTVLKIETASLLPSNTEQPLPLPGVQLLAPVHGMQGGPVGGERVILMRRHSGWLALLEHGKDDSPGAPAGEKWLTHKSGSSQKFQNSGNVSTTANATHQIQAVTITHTASGNATLSATNAMITGTAAASVIAPSTAIGPSGGPYLNIGSGGLGGTYALVRVFELNALVASFNTHVHSGVQGGISNTGATTVPAIPAVGSTNTTAG